MLGSIDHLSDNLPTWRHRMARKAQYTAQLSVLIEPSDHDRLRAIERAQHISMSEVIRQLLTFGLPMMEARYPLGGAADTDYYQRLQKIEHSYRTGLADLCRQDLPAGLPSTAAEVMPG